MAEKNVPIAEPFAGRMIGTMQSRREEKWPNLRFSVASFYKVGKSSEAPQYMEIMEKKANQDIQVVVLAFGNGKDSTIYCPAEEGPLYVGPTSVLMGEPKDEWLARQQSDFRHVENRIAKGPAVSNNHEAEVTVGDLVDAGTYSRKDGKQDELT